MLSNFSLKAQTDKTKGRIPLYEIDNDTKVRCILYDGKDFERGKNLSARADG